MSIRRWQKYLSSSLVVLTALVAAYLGGVVTGRGGQLHKPYCPQEDSCTIDYHNQEWHIEEVAP